VADEDFLLLPSDEMRRRFGLYAENRPFLRLNPDRVPVTLRLLIPLAELWGVGDDLIREDMIRKAPPEALRRLRETLAQFEEELDAWLAGPEADGPEFCEEYLAFSSMRMAADGF
jgi:hypothetical protein